MVVPKACFSVLLGLDVMRPLGTVIDLQQDTFAFSDKATGQRVQVALQCTKNRKTLSDVKAVTTVHHVRMFRSIPAHEGPITGQSFFPDTDHLSPISRIWSYSERPEVHGGRKNE